jgi:hypothetical protein
MVAGPVYGAKDAKPAKTKVTFDEEKFPPSGTVSSKNEHCVKGRKVTLYAGRFGGEQEPQGSDRASKQGKWKVPVEGGSFPPDTVKIYASVSAISGGGKHPFACKADKSNELEIGN